MESIKSRSELPTSMIMAKHTKIHKLLPIKTNMCFDCHSLKHLLWPQIPLEIQFHVDVVVVQPIRKGPEGLLELLELVRAEVPLRAHGEA